MLEYANRIGITIVGRSKGDTMVENYINHSGILKEFPELIKMDKVGQSVEEERLIKGIKNLIS